MVRAVLKSYRKNILREMKDNLSRMVSLFGIVALGVMMLTGLMSFAPSMRIAGQKYYVQQNVFDLRVLSTLVFRRRTLPPLPPWTAWRLCSR